MKYREIKYLSETNEFFELCIKYNLKHRIIGNIIYLFSKCYVIEIFGFVTEDHLYFEVFILQNKKHSTIGTLLSIKDNKSVKEIYSNELKKRVFPINRSSNIENSLNIEQYFFAYLKLIDNFLEDFMKCNFKLYDSLFKITFKNKIDELNKIFEE